LSNASGGQRGSLLLNLADGQQNPITLEVGLVRCGEAILLLGTQEHRHDSDFRTEILQQTSDLSVMMREAAQKNRQLKDANETIERLASTDALTGLANRRTLNEALQREVASAERMAECLSVIIADLDHFKSVNDEYGHATGDDVRRAWRRFSGGNHGRTTWPSRYGGEEFVLLVPGASTENAIGIAERIRKEIAEVKVPGIRVRLQSAWVWPCGEKGKHQSSWLTAPMRPFTTPRTMAGTESSLQAEVSPNDARINF
jgi:diguanylate cyclase (GGDEF)-like protein